MHHIHKEVLLPYEIEQIYSVVSDVKLYPEFIPWCSKLELIEKISQNKLLARVVVSALGFCIPYFSEIVLSPPSQNIAYVTAISSSEPFHTMETSWSLMRSQEGKVLVSFDTKFSLKSKGLNTAIGYMLPLACAKIMQSFVNRVEEMSSVDIKPALYNTNQ